MNNLYDATTISAQACKGYNTNSLHKYRHEITKSGADGDEDVLLKFLPFEGKYVSIGAVWRHNAPQEATRATVISSRPHTMRDAVIPLLVPLEAATEPLQTRLGQSPQLNWRLPMTPQSFTTMDYGSTVTSTV